MDNRAIIAAGCGFMIGGCSAAGWNAFAVAMSAPAPASSSPQYSQPAPVVEDHRCFVAYVHGLNPAQNLSPGIASDDDRRAYWQPTRGAAAGDFVAASSRQGQPKECRTLVVGYDSLTSFVDASDERAVASQIADFIRAESIPDDRLIIIAHSMGGLLVRHILNQGPSPAGSADFQTVNQKTRYVITLGTPHLGSPAADQALAPTNPCSFVGGLWMAMWGVAIPASALSMTTTFMNSVSAVDRITGDTPLGDRRRTRTIYTVGGFEFRPGSHPIAQIDNPLRDAHGWNCFGMISVTSDGIVPFASAMGFYETSGSSLGRSWSAGDHVQGPFVEWLAVALNHNHIHFNDEVAEIRNRVTGQTTSATIGTYIAEHMGEDGLEIQ